MTKSLEEYSCAALRTDAPISKDTKERLTCDARLLHGAIGVASEAGELLSALKAYVYYGKDLDEANLKEEIGDMCWFINLLLDDLGLTWDEVLESNLRKLRTRYPDKFERDLAIDRNLGAEREAL